MADTDVRNSAINLVEQYKEHASGYHSKVVSAVILGSTLNEKGTTVSPLRVDLVSGLPAGTAAIGSLTASTAAIGHVTLDASTALIGGLNASESHVGEVGGKTAVVVATPACSTTIYAIGDLIGGKLTLAGATRVAAGTGVIHSVVVADKGQQLAALDVVFFKADLSTGTTFTDNAAFAPADADLLNIAGHVSIAAIDYSSFSDNAVATKAATGLAFALSTGTALYAAVVSRGAPTYSSAGDLQVTVKIFQD